MNNNRYDWAPAVVKDLLHHDKGKLCIYCETCGKSRPTSGKGQVIERASKEFRECRECTTARHRRYSKEDIASWLPGTKRCIDCLAIKEISEFHNSSRNLLGVANRCKACRRPYAQKKWEESTFEATMLSTAKSRARKKNVVFDLKITDIVIPEICPILKVKIVCERNHPYGPSLDRIIPEKGYIKENVRVVSNRGNSLKSNMTAEEALSVARDLVDIQSAQSA